MGVRERVGEREPDPQRRRGPTARRRLASAVQRAPAHQLGDEVARLVVLAGVEHGDDARVVEPRGGQRLARRALGRRRARRDAPSPRRRGRAARRRPRRPCRTRRSRAAPEAVAAQHGGGRRHRCGEPSRGAPPWPPSEVGSAALAPPLPAALVAVCRLLAADVPVILATRRVLLRRGRRAPHAGRRGHAAHRAGDVSADTQTIRVRQAAAAIGLIVVLLLLVFVVKGCRSSAKENALKDYNREVSTIASESSAPGRRRVLQAAQRGRQRVAAGPADGDLELPRAGRAAAQAGRGPRRPGRDARRAPVAADRARVAPRRPRHIAQQIRTALGDEGDAADEAIKQIAGQMQVFLASDVAYTTRVRPLIKAALDDSEIGGQEIAPSTVPARRSTGCSRTSSRSQLGQQLSAGAGPRQERADGPRPARHEASTRSTYGDTTLQPGTPNQLTYAPDSTFAVKFTNGGENDEFDVKVTVQDPGRERRPDHADRHDRPGRPRSASATAELAARAAAAARRRGDHHRAGRAGPGRGEDRQQPGRVPGHLRGGLIVRSGARGARS